MLEPEKNFRLEATMAFSLQEVRANRDYFVHKLRAEKQRNDVLKAVEGGKFDFVLLDTRGREPFAKRTYSRRVVRTGGGDRSSGATVADGPRDCHLLLGP